MASTREKRPSKHVEIPLSYSTPPLNANQRLHWAHKAKITREIRHEVCWRVKAEKLPPADRIIFELHYLPKQNRRRDLGNLMPTHKAGLDGVVDSGLISDDTPEFVQEKMPVIHRAVKDAPVRLWLAITIKESA